jgi:FOG: EAL domain
MGHRSGRCKREAILVAIACFLLPFLPIPYWPEFRPYAGPSSLANLHWGLLLALAMLMPDRRYFHVGFLALLLSWCAQLVLLYPGEVVQRFLGTLPLYLSMYGWTLLCARLAGWPRQRLLFRQEDIIPFGAAAFALYPAGWAVAHLAFAGLFSGLEGEALFEQAIRVGFSRFYGVLCVTLPLVLWVTGRREPAPMQVPLRAWEVVLVTAYSLLLGVMLWAVPSPSGHLLGGLLDQRLMFAGLVMWAVLRLPWRWSAPLIACVTTLLVYLVGAGTRSGLRTDALQLLQIGLEMSMAQQLMVLTLVISRDNRRAMARLAEEGRRDGLSGVPNLNALRHDLARRDSPPAEIACLGVEHLDSLMAGLGLPAQEALTAALYRHLGPDVQAYTLGMGRFVLVPDTDQVSWKALLARVEQFEFRYDNVCVRIEPHLGVAMLRDASPQAVELALHAAYGAMQCARDRGETAPVFAQGQSDPVALRALLETHSLALSLLRRRRIELHVQPIRRLGEAVPAMGEILCRLRDDDGRLLLPHEYMAELEASRGVVELDRAVIEHLLKWMRAHPGPLPYRRLAVNLTGRSLISEQFRNWLLYQLDALPGCASRLCFEVTERAVSGGMAQARPLLEGLSRRGCLIALDDFGTGMQSFERLQQLPIDLIKIDGSFIRNIARNPRDRDLVRAMVAIARAYQAETVAEYVEDEAILAELGGLGVDWVQGYHIGRPGPLPRPGPAAAPAEETPAG